MKLKINYFLLFFLLCGVQVILPNACTKFYRCFSKGMQSKMICPLLYKEYRTGLIQNEMHYYFLKLNDEDALQVGPKIAAFRTTYNRYHKLKLFKEICDLLQCEYKFVRI